MVGIVERIAPQRIAESFCWLLGSSWMGNIGDGIVLAAGSLLVASQTRDPFLVAMAVLQRRAAGPGGQRPNGGPANSSAESSRGSTCEVQGRVLKLLEDPWTGSAIHQSR